MKLSDYAEKVLRSRGDPNTMADLHIELAVVYAQLTEEYQYIKVRKAAFWQKKFEGTKPLSDTHLEMMWRGTEDGKQELRIKYTLTGLDKLVASIKSALVVESFNMRNAA